MNNNTRVVDTAMRYVAAGISVFPLNVTITAGRKKVSPISNWDGASSTDPATVREWFDQNGRWRTASLGIDCGKSGLVVVDLDGADGIANWDALVITHRFGATWRSSTPGGGQHWYFRADPAVALGNSASKVAPRVDVRGAGGFVIAPPSTDARGRYTWLEGEPEWAQLPVLPQLVVDRTATRPQVPHRVYQPGGNGTQRRFTYAQAVEFCRPSMESLRAAHEGTRNDALNIAAKVLSHFVPQFWSFDQAAGWLDGALDPAYPRDEAALTTDSAFRSAATDWVAEKVESDRGTRGAA
jgi:bifunctional DNA primase/polymerase-like protein